MSDPTTIQGLPALNRWLGRSRIDPIRRTRGQLQFTLANSDVPARLDILPEDFVDVCKIGQINFRSGHNYAVRRDDNLAAFTAVADGFSICVTMAYVVAGSPTNTVVRYKLGSSDFGVYSNIITPYTGQVIKGAYSMMEFWVDGPTIDDLTNLYLVLLGIGVPHVFNTSVLGNQDTRYGLPFSIGSVAPVVVSAFSQSNPDVPGNFNLPITFNTNIINGVNT